MKVYKSTLFRAMVCAFLPFLLISSFRGLSQETDEKNPKAATPAPKGSTIPEGVSFACPDIQAKVKRALAAGKRVRVTLPSGKTVPISQAPPGRYGGGGYAEWGGVLNLLPKGKPLESSAVMKEIVNNPVGAMYMLEWKMQGTAIPRLMRTRYRTYLANVLVEGGLNPGTAAMYISEGVTQNVAQMLSSHHLVPGMGGEERKNDGSTGSGQSWKSMGLVQLATLMQKHLKDGLSSENVNSEALPASENEDGGWIKFHGVGWAGGEQRFKLPEGKPFDVQEIKFKIRKRPFLFMCLLEVNMAESRVPEAQRPGYRVQLAQLLIENGSIDPGTAALYTQEGLSPSVAQMLFTFYGRSR